MGDDGIIFKGKVTIEIRFVLLQFFTQAFKGTLTPSLLLLSTRPIVPKLDELCAIATAYSPTLIIVAENWLNEEICNNQTCPVTLTLIERTVGKNSDGVCVRISADVRKSTFLLVMNYSLPFESLWMSTSDCRILLAACIPPNLSRDIGDHA